MKIAFLDKNISNRLIRCIARMLEDYLIKMSNKSIYTSNVLSSNKTRALFLCRMKEALLCLIFKEWMGLAKTRTHAISIEADFELACLETRHF